MLEVKKTLRIKDQLISFGNYILRGEQAGSLVYENLDNGQIVYFTKEILKTIKNHGRR